MSNPNENIKVRQKRFVMILVAGIIALSVIVTFLRGGGGETQAIKHSDESVIIERYSAIGKNIDEQRAWMSYSSNEIDDLKNQNRELRNQIGSLKTTMRSEIEREINKVKSDLKEDIKKASAQKTEQHAQTPIKKVDIPEETPEVNRTALPFGSVAEEVRSELDSSQERRGTIITNRYYNNPDIGKYKGEDLVPKKQILSIEFGGDEVVLDTNFEEGNVIQVASIDDKDLFKTNVEITKNSSNYLPAGTFIRAIVLGALDAPTGGQAQTNPHPVLLELDGVAQLPNDLSLNLKKCRIVAAGYGDLSSERAIIRTETMSCIDKDGNIIEHEMRGYIFGEDGKQGMRGTVITKQGQLLANSLIAGIGAGIGNAFQKQATSYSTSPLGSVATIDPDKIAVAGLGQGVGSALDRLSKYYIDLAEQLFPIIEISAGRAVDVVLTRGMWVDGKAPSVNPAPTIPGGINDLVSNGQNVISQTQELLNQAQ